MSSSAPIPRLLLISAGVMAAEAFVLSFLEPVSALTAVGLAITLLLAWLVLRGSRIAWVLALLGAIGQLAGPLVFGDPIWVVASSSIVIAGLLSPNSRSYVWSEARRSSENRLSAALRRRYDWLSSLPYSLEDEAGRVVGRLVNRRVIVRVLAWTVALAVVAGIASSWHQGSGADSVVVGVFWRVTWGVFMLAQLALIGLLAMAAYGYLKSRLTKTGP